MTGFICCFTIIRLLHGYGNGDSTTIFRGFLAGMGMINNVKHRGTVTKGIGMVPAAIPPQPIKYQDS